MDNQAEFMALDAEYRKYVGKLQAAWIARNRSTSRDVLEVMSPRDREEVDNIIARWGRYITPLAEAWWRERGYEVIWPDDNSKPVQFRKLD